MAACQTAAHPPNLSLDRRERFYSAYETLEQIAVEMNGGIAEEGNPDPIHERGSSSVTAGMQSGSSSSLGDPVESESEVPQHPQIAIPNNTLSARIIFEIPDPNGPGTKTIDFPLGIDLSKPPRPSRNGQPPTYEVNIPVVMSEQKMHQQEMSREIGCPASSFKVPRTESNCSTCSFGNWGFTSCCRTSRPEAPEHTSVTETSTSGGDRFRNMFGMWPSRSPEPSLGAWDTESNESRAHQRPPGVPPIRGINNLELASNTMCQKTVSDFGSAVSKHSWDIDSSDTKEGHHDNDSKSSKISLSDLILKPLSPEGHSQQGLPRLPVSPMFKKTAVDAKGIDDIHCKMRTWEKTKSLGSPGRTGGYGETAVDIIPEILKQKENAAAVDPKEEVQPPVEVPDHGGSTARSSGSLVEGIATVGRKISSTFQNIVRKLTLSPVSEITVPDGDDPFTPGIGWVPRPDEVGEGVKTVAELKKLLSGTWVRDPNSDTPEAALDILEMPWLAKRALMIASQTEIKVLDDKIYVSPKLFGITAPQESFFGREGRLQSRRDRRKGLSRIALVPTKTGVRQYNQWGEPFQGISLMEIDVSEDGRTLTSNLVVKLKNGRKATVRSVMHRCS